MHGMKLSDSDLKLLEESIPEVRWSYKSIFKDTTGKSWSLPPLLDDEEREQMRKFRDSAVKKREEQLERAAAAERENSCPLSSTHTTPPGAAVALRKTSHSGEPVKEPAYLDTPARLSTGRRHSPSPCQLASSAAFEQRPTSQHGPPFLRSSIVADGSVSDSTSYPTNASTNTVTLTSNLLNHVALDSGGASFSSISTDINQYMSTAIYESRDSHTISPSPQSLQTSVTGEAGAEQKNASATEVYDSRPDTLTPGVNISRVISQQFGESRELEDTLTSISQQPGGEKVFGALAKAVLNYLTEQQKVRHLTEEDVLSQMLVEPAARPHTAGTVSTADSSWSNRSDQPSSTTKRRKQGTVPRTGSFEKLPALMRGYLTRRLLKTPKVWSLIRTIRDTESLYRSSRGDNSSAALLDRLAAQLRSAKQHLHATFADISVRERMTMIANLREFERAKFIQEMDRAEGKGAPVVNSRAVSNATAKRHKEKESRPKTAPGKDATAPVSVHTAPPNKFKFSLKNKLKGWK